VKTGYSESRGFAALLCGKPRASGAEDAPEDACGAVEGSPLLSVRLKRDLCLYRIHHTNLSRTAIEP